MLEKYIGIADAHGLESFLKYEEHKDHLGFLVMRASLNRQRHALVYQVELTANQADAIARMMANEKYILACRALHDPAFLVDSPIGVENDMVDSWELIPNPRLDPYGGRFAEDSEEMDADIEPPLFREDYDDLPQSDEEE